MFLKNCVNSGLFQFTRSLLWINSGFAFGVQFKHCRVKQTCLLYYDGISCNSHPQYVLNTHVVSAFRAQPLIGIYSLCPLRRFFGSVGFFGGGLLWVNSGSSLVNSELTPRVNPGFGWCLISDRVGLIGTASNQPSYQFSQYLDFIIDCAFTKLWVCVIVLVKRYKAFSVHAYSLKLELMDFKESFFIICYTQTNKTFKFFTVLSEIIHLKIDNESSQTLRHSLYIDTSSLNRSDIVLSSRTPVFAYCVVFCFGYIMHFNLDERC